MKHLRLWIAAGLLLTPALTAAQSLADVARAEQARRKTAPKAEKIYTNDDLHADPRARAPVPAAPASPVPAPPATEPPVPAAAPAPAVEEPAVEPKHDETYWRDRMSAARGQLQRSKLFAEALQSRINALGTDFVNRDDPAQRALIAQDRQTALAELARVQNETRDLTKVVADIEEDARRAGVPPGWLR